MLDGQPILGKKQKRSLRTLKHAANDDEMPTPATLAAMDNQNDRCEKPRRLWADAARRRPIRRRVVPAQSSAGQSDMKGRG